MKHRVAGKKLNRSTKHRQALYKNLMRELITHGSITTTKTKAKAVQGQFDKLITKAKKDSVHHRRQIDKVLSNTSLVNKLVDQIAKKTNKTSGFTRIIPLGVRRGDNTQMAKIEIISASTKEQSKSAKEKKS